MIIMYAALHTPMHTEKKTFLWKDDQCKALHVGVRDQKPIVLCKRCNHLPITGFEKLRIVTARLLTEIMVNELSPYCDHHFKHYPRKLASKKLICKSNDIADIEFVWWWCWLGVMVGGLWWWCMQSHIPV